MSIELPWMRPDAPYMPIATVGLLAAMEDAGVPATAKWRESSYGHTLWLETDRTAEQAAGAVIDAPWPNLDRIAWPGATGQAIKPILADASDPVGTLRRLRERADADGLVAEGRLLRALVTDAVLDGAGTPSRSRLLRGVKADLSGVTEKVPLKVADLAVEMVSGPVWRNGKSGRGLGFVPEVQTFGGTTGRKPSDVGSHSVLLYRLLWLGILSLPPIGVVRRGRRTVGGPLVTGLRDGDVTLSWPTWTFDVGLTELRSLFLLPEVHDDRPDPEDLGARGIVAVHRATSIPINSMIGMFRWGEQVA